MDAIYTVMPGLGPGIPVFFTPKKKNGRYKPGHH
jgi:hypothetical protein